MTEAGWVAVCVCVCVCQSSKNCNGVAVLVMAGQLVWRVFGVGGSALSSHSSNNAPLRRPHIYQSRASLSLSLSLSLLFFLSAIFIQHIVKCKVRSDT